MTKTCKTCNHSQDGFFNPALLFCGAKGTQVVEVKPDDKCDWWEEKEQSMTEIEYAINNLQDFLAADIGQGDLHMSTAETALFALREMAERNKGCPLCHMDNRMYHFAGNPPNFCPNCGADMREGRQC